MALNVDVFSETFRRDFPDRIGTPILVALSGGADSTALLHLLHRSDLGFDLHAVHVHHGVRGHDADEDARFCRELCRELGIDFTRVDLPDRSSPSRGREADWRELRYRALFEVASDHGIKTVATAHHRDDVAEGVLLQLLRGAGPRAMAGIHARIGILIRPLLTFSRSEIRGWLVEHSIPWREDSSNASPSHLRNDVRNRILPLIERDVPSIRRHLVRLAAALAETEAHLGRELGDLGLDIEPWHPEGGVPIERVSALSGALRIRWLHRQAEKNGFGPVTRRQGDLLPTVLDGSNAALTLGRRWTLRRAARRLWLEPPPGTPGPYEIDLAVDREINLPLPGWRITLRDRTLEDGIGPWTIPVPEDGVFQFRSPRPGDCLEDGRTVASVLRLSLPRHLRRVWPILWDGDKLLWIPGVAFDTIPVDGPRIVEVART